MTLREAQEMIELGVEFGEVYPLLDNGYGENLKQWYLTTPGLPNLTGRKKMNAPQSGNACTKCGGMLVRDGKCELCVSCGETVGSCS